MNCGECGAVTPDHANFCHRCGLPVSPSLDRSGAERRPIHVVFCDVVGSTALSERLDPEDFRGLLQYFHRTCSEIVRRLEGHLAQLLGDGALVYFGYPRAHDDDACRAVRAGLEIVQAMSRSAPVAGFALRVRVGIHSGVVVVGEVGVSGHRAELAVGETPHIAARVQAEAEPDTVVISQSTERLVRGFFAIEPLGLRSLRGIVRPIALFRVVAASGARNRLEASKAGGLTPLVARDTEVAILRRDWAEAANGHGRVVALRGEAGVGKSRLVETFKAGLTERHQVIHCACAEHLRNTAFHPLAAALEHELGMSGRPSLVGDVHQYAARFGLPPPEAARVIADLLSVRLEPANDRSDQSPASRRQLRQLTMTALSTWLLGAGEDLPTLVVLEDVHWSDASTLELTEAVVRELSSRRVLVLLTFRPEFTPPAELESSARLVQLHPLGRADASLVASYVAGGKSLPPEVLDRLDEWTKGVPLFIEEFTKGVIESEALIEREDRFDLAGGLPTTVVPETLAGPLAATIDRLSNDKPVAQLASVLGVEFRVDLLGAIAKADDSELRSAIDRLVAAQLVIPSADSGSTSYRFRHALLREAAYNSVLRAERREIHRRVVEALRTHFASWAESRPEIVAYHAAEGGMSREAISYWLSASKKALHRAANWEALAHIEDGLRQLDHIPEGAERWEAQLAFELSRGPALMAVKGFAAPEVKHTYRRARALCDNLGNVSRIFSVLWGLWANQFVAGELGAARDLSDQVFEIAERTGDAALRVPACHALGYTLCYAAEFERALEVARLGIGLLDLELERSNVREYQFSSTVALRNIASVSLWMLGFPDQAQSEAHEGIVFARSLEHPPTLAYALSALTWGAAFLNRDFVAVDQAALEAIQVSSEQQFAFWPPFVEVFRGWAMAGLGDVRRGLAHMFDAYERYRSTGGGILRPTMNAAIAEAAFRCGDGRRALHIVASALADIVSTGEHNYEPELHRVRGEVLASPAAGSMRSDEHAEASLRLAVEVARQQRARSLELRAALSLSAFLGARGRTEEGRSLVAGILGSFTEGFGTRDLRAARLLVAE